VYFIHQKNDKTMKTKMILILINLSIFNFSYGQNTGPDLTARTGLSGLQFMTGHWTGSGWMTGRDGQKHSFIQSEEVQFKLDSTLLLVEGIGRSEGKIIHNALAIVTFNKNDGNYIFQSYLSDGRNGSFTGELVDGKFYWYPNENIRYIISLNEKNQWYENGEMKRNDDWFQFFEMTLDRTE
jgi:hypothetical protein